MVKFPLIRTPFALALGVAALGSAALSAPTNKQLTIGVSQEFENLNPIIAQMATTSYLNYMVSSQLVSIDADWKWICILCTELPTLENGRAKIIEEKGQKKLVATWTIKPDAQWGDGKPLTGHDAKKSWEIGLDKGVSVGEKDLYERIESIDVDPKDPKTFTMKFKEPRYDYYEIGTFRIVPAHIEGPVLDKAKGQTGIYEKQTVFNTNPTNPGLYSGPYVVKEIKLGSHVILERNPKYFGNKPAIEKIILKLIPNTQTLEANLLSGTIDMIGELGVTFDQALAFEKRQKTDPALKTKYETLFVDGMQYEHIDLNLRNPVLQDVNVRKALLYGVDRDRLTQALFEGRQKKAITWLHPKDIYWTTNVTQYPYDAKKAGELLDAAGWKVGPGGIRQKDGKKLTLNIMTTSQNKVRELVEVFLQQEWKKIGVDLTIQNEPARVFFGETVRKGLYPALAMFTWVSSPDNPPRSTLHSAEIPTKANAYAGQNSGAWVNKKVDEALDKIKLEFDPNKRKVLVEEIAKAYTEEVPTLPLYMRAEVAVVPKNLKGYKITGHQFYSTVFVDQWNLEGAGQGH